MNIEQIRLVLVVGAGTMGQQISLQCAMHGYDVVIYDLSHDSLKNAMTQIKAYAAQLVTEGHLIQEVADTVLARITFTNNPKEAAEKADLLSESVPEDPELKAKVFAQFNKLCPPRTIFTTNTSGLVPSMFAEATGRPSQFAAFHFHQIVWIANVVDIMPHPRTSKETVDLLHAFAKRIGQIPIFVRKENPAYVFNAMYNAWNEAAIKLLIKGVASVEDIDRAWMGVTKMPMGPFGGLDLVGLETVWRIADHMAKQTKDPEYQAMAAFFKDYVDKDWLGVKSGRGFYTYPNPAFQQPGFLTGENQQKKNNRG